MVAAYLAHWVDKLGDDGRPGAPRRLVVVEISVRSVLWLRATRPDLQHPRAHQQSTLLTVIIDYMTN